MKSRSGSMMAVLVAIILAVMAVPAQTPRDRITIDELKAKIERNEKLLILDARYGNSWLGSRVQIKGAYHFTLEDVEKSVDLLKGEPRGREIIIYCT
jgi:rhodanese-related sulfurtransferase